MGREKGKKMSVAESNIVDGIALEHEGSTLILLITDHLDWEGESDFTRTK